MQNTDTGGIRREHIRPLEREISGTTYIVTGQFSATARETAVEKNAENYTKRIRKIIEICIK